MKLSRFIIIISIVSFVLILLFPYCSGRQVNGLDVTGVTANNKGVALMGQFDYEAARKVFQELVDMYPKNDELKINLAIATLNRQRDGDEEDALDILQGVLTRDPENTRARYCAALLKLHMGDAAEALVYFRRVIESTPKDPDVYYFTGKTLMQLSRYQEAIQYFKTAISHDQYLRSAHYGIIMALRQMGKMEESMEMIKEFQKLKQNPRARLVEFKYTKMGRNAEALVIDQEKKKSIPIPNGSLFKKMRTIVDNTEIKWRRSQAHENTISSITVCDTNNDGHADIFITNAVESKDGFTNILLMGKADGTYIIDQSHPLTTVSDVNAALWGDIDDDGQIDVYLCRRGPNRLYRQNKEGKWLDITPETNTSCGNYNTVDGAMFDADHDGDLDLFLVNNDGPNELLNNNRDGSFRPLAKKYGLEGNGTPSRSILLSDLDSDRDTDIVIINNHPPHEVYINQRLWEYTPGIGYDAFISAPVTAAVPADLDIDGRVELYTLDTQQSLSCWHPDSKEIWNATVISTESESKSPASVSPTSNSPYNHLAITDINGDGKQNIILSNNNGWKVFSLSGGRLHPMFTTDKKETAPPLTWSFLHSSNGPHFIGWAPGKAPYVLPPGPGRHEFALISLSGMREPGSDLRSNASGIGSRLSLRIGSQWTVLDTFRNNSGPGQSLQAVSVGMAGAKRIDFAAIDWTDGVFQTELNLEKGKKHRVVEIQRQLSSCPVLFAWNGKTFEFVSDMLGVAGVGYSVGPGEYTEPRPWENFMFPQNFLQPRDKRIMFKLTEPMEEITYLDAVRLKAYDLPPGWSMTMDERMKVLGPDPTGKPVFYRSKLIPSTAINERNQDVTETILKQDLKAAPPGELDSRFIGRLKGEHILTLTFSDPLSGKLGTPVLIADGWVEYPYSQTNFAAWQAGADYRAPTLEVRKPNGEWIVLFEQFGYPAGMPRQMSLPLEGIPDGVREIRIRTNQEIYWDCLAVVFAEPCNQVFEHYLELAGAEIEQIGFPKRSHLPQRLPYYDYDTRLPLWDTHFLEGFYTRFGEVAELVSKCDDGVVIFGSGEGVHFEFNVLNYPLPKGWNRIYVIETDGWCKDMDLFTRTGDTVEPLPSKNKPGKRVQDLHNKYNTRYLAGRQ